MKAMVLFSGGLDSTTCLALAIERFGREHVVPLSISYGQKHEKELEAAKSILDYYELSGITLDLSPVFQFSCSSLLTHSAEVIPKESYARQLSKSGEHPVSTYVPFRNGLFLSAAASAALSLDCTHIYYGAHQDDAAGNAYPDCSQMFFDSIRQAIHEGSGKQLTLEAPFIKLTKTAVVTEGLRLQVPYQYTWSCYEGHEYACGCCATCLDRKKAFKANHITDPITYER